MKILDTRERKIYSNDRIEQRTLRYVESKTRARKIFHRTEKLVNILFIFVVTINCIITCITWRKERENIFADDDRSR